MRMRALIIIFVLAGTTGTSGQTALETNSDVLARLAVECTSPATEGLESVALQAPSRLPFLRSGLVSALEMSGMSVFESGTPSHPALTLSLENAGVSYDRRGRGFLRRTLRLVLSVRLVDGSGQVRHDALCSSSFEDVISTDALPAVENQTYPETRGTVPLSRWKRLVQPVVIAAASAAGTLLFFSLRSKRSGGG